MASNQFRVEHDFLGDRELILRDKLLTNEQLDAILDPFEMTSPGIAGAKQPNQEHVWKDQDEEDKR